MADWLGHLLGSLPGWLFLPALIIVVIISAALWFVFGTAGGGIGGDVLFKGKKAYLGESKKDGKK